MIALYIGLGVIAVLGILVVILYNSLKKMQVMAEEAFSTIDVYLKKRFDLVQSLVSTVKGYMSHEKSTLESIVSERNKFQGLTRDMKITQDESVSQMLDHILINVENYPTLKASESFLKLSDSLVQIENDLANARKYYNGVCRVFNTKCRVFPSNIVANLFKFKTIKMYEAQTNERNDVKVTL